jgi:hypothetical protein
MFRHNPLKINNKQAAIFHGNNVWTSCNHITKKKKLRGLSPQANYTDRVTAACRRSYCQI